MDLSRRYGFHATGTGFAAAVARFILDGNGGLTGKLFGRVPGTKIWTYRIYRNLFVSPDCARDRPWLGSTHVSVIVRIRAKGYFILNTSPSTGTEGHPEQRGEQKVAGGRS